MLFLFETHILELFEKKSNVKVKKKKRNEALDI